MKRKALYLLLALLPTLCRAAGNYPYGMNLSYAFGLKPPSPATGSWANDNSTILGKYNSWKAVHVVSAGGSLLRVQRDSANGYDTVSEGVSYGMLLAVYFDDQTTYNGLWAY